MCPFRVDQSKALEQYLKAVHDDSLELVEVELPCPIIISQPDSITVLNTFGYGANAVGGPTDFYMLNCEDGYNLPFEVWGYFDVREAAYKEELAASDEYFKAFLQHLNMPIPTDDELHQARHSAFIETGVSMETTRQPIKAVNEDFGAGAPDVDDDDFDPFAEE